MLGALDVEEKNTVIPNSAYYVWYRFGSDSVVEGRHHTRNFHLNYVPMARDLTDTECVFYDRFGKALMVVPQPGIYEMSDDLSRKLDRRLDPRTKPFCVTIQLHPKKKLVPRRVTFHGEDGQMWAAADYPDIEKGEMDSIIHYFDDSEHVWVNLDAVITFVNDEDEEDVVSCMGCC